MASTYISSISKENSQARSWALAIVFSLAIMTCASKIYFNLPFTPVPVTLGPMGPILCGVLFGPKRAFSGVISYLVLGMMGLPVLASSTISLAYFFGPTGGYILGYAIEAYAAGYLFETFKPAKAISAFLIAVCCQLIQYSCGLVGLSFFVPYESLLACGVLPFILGDVAKCAFAAGLYGFVKRKW